MAEKLMKKCPVCKSEDIEQDFIPYPNHRNVVIRTTGSHCNNCGTRFAFNKELKNETTNRRTD